MLRLMQIQKHSGQAYRAKLRSLPQDYDGQDADDVKFPIQSNSVCNIWESKERLKQSKIK